MAAGDKEIVAALQETTTRNVQAVVVHSNITRDLVRDLEEKVQRLDDLIRQYDQKFELLQKQMVVLQTKLFSGGS